MNNNSSFNGEYVVIRAEENGVTIMGLTRGEATRFHHTEKLDKGEVYIAQFTEITSAIKIKGKAKVYTTHGIVDVGNADYTDSKLNR